MQVKYITSERHEEWNNFASSEPSFALLQSWEWGEFKKMFGWQALRIAVEDDGQIFAGAQVLIKQLPLKLGSVVYVPRGPIGNWLDKKMTPLLLSELHRVSRQYSAILMKIEPPILHDPAIERELRQYQFQPSNYSNQPRATIRVDLTKNLEDILNQMRKKTRQYIRSASRKGIIVRKGGRKDLPAFYDLMRLTGRREHFPARTRRYYEKEWQIFADKKHVVLLMAFYKDQLMAVRTAYRFGKHAAEFHAGSLDKSVIMHSNYLLVWEAIKWAKEHGCCTYDLWGIPDEVGYEITDGNKPPVSSRTDGLWGVYRFKSGFSKNIVSYAGAYDYVYKTLLYKLITNRFVKANMLDQLAAWMDWRKT